MCRLLYARADAPFSIPRLLGAFAELARTSREYQGHGWGCAWREGGGWRQYHDIQPVWEDDLAQFGETRLLLAHARSAFRDEGITVDNNMPFGDGESMFIFNGELRGVRIKADGRIGAEKVFNYIRRFDRGDKCAATAKAVGIIEKRSAYLRALNLVLSDGERGCVSTTYNEDPEYFQMYEKRTDGMHLICSQPFAGESGWQPIANRTTRPL